MHKLLSVNDNGRETELILNSDEDIKLAAKHLSEIIINEYESNIIDFLIRNNYTYLKKNEQMFVKEKGIKFLSDNQSKTNNSLYEKIYKFIREEDIIDLKGFLRFRAKDYIATIENAIDSAVNEFIIESEYNQLIEGLILYAELQIPLIDTINIIQLNDTYIITNKKGEEILTIKYYDDVLLDIILTLAPTRIIIINADKFKNKELLDTVKRIFSSKVIFINNAEIDINNKLYTSKGDKE